ncbi:urease accessory protein UreE [Leucothrix pacifica]|uniref:Urease accessory protein UreE n=1 Tax=Leucothrix pacifica TaxID=1247513 RepID=A0A317CPS2_9GAMM|nr:urease accessory protein UreE [Leucothrix pacifica]PWR00559.1 urease accessory protein UreE [Leucothrix pacifica]
MIKLTEKIDAATPAAASVTLPLDLRIKTRQRVTLDSGEDAGIFLEKGAILRGGEKLKSEEGLVVEIIAADETVSSVYVEDGLALAKAAYHLGNRHIPLQIEAGLLRYQHDHVLDDMIQGFGLSVTVESVPFEPEGGAYKSGAGHSHGAHSHGHSHDHHGGHSHG